MRILLRHYLSRAVMLFAMCVVSISLPANAQTIVRSFDGDKGPVQEQCNAEELRCGRQPEMVAAANGRQVVQVTWQHVNIYDYTGKLLHSSALPEFLRKAGVDPMPKPRRADAKDHGPFEPHLVFDEFIGRWVMNLTCLNDCFLVSASADAAGPWHGIYPTCLQGGPCLNNDPSLQLGYDKNGVYHCAAHLGDDDPNTIPGVAYDCFAIPSAEVKGIGQGREPMHLNRHHHLPMHIRPSIDQNSKKGANTPAMFAARTCNHAEGPGCQRGTNFPFQWLVNTFTWHGAEGAWSSDQVIKTDVGSKQNKWLYNIPCCGTASSVPQAGSDVQVRAQESHRLNNLVQNGSHLQVVFGAGGCTHDCGAQGEDKGNVMFWADLDCSDLAACRVAQTAKIADENVNPLFPTVGVDNEGNIGIIAASSSATMPLSILLWTHRASDPPNSFSPPMTVVAGTQPYTCPNRMNLALIASAVGMLTVRDPLDSSKLWTTHQYSGDATACVWNSRIFEYQLTPSKRPARQ